MKKLLTVAMLLTSQAALAKTEVGFFSLKDGSKVCAEAADTRTGKNCVVLQNELSNGEVARFRVVYDERTGTVVLPLSDGTFLYTKRSNVIALPVNN